MRERVLRICEAASTGTSTSIGTDAAMTASYETRYFYALQPSRTKLGMCHSLTPMKTAYCPYSQRWIAKD